MKINKLLLPLISLFLISCGNETSTLSSLSSTSSFSSEEVVSEVSLEESSSLQKELKTETISLLDTFYSASIDISTNTEAFNALTEKFATFSEYLNIEKVFGEEYGIRLGSSKATGYLGFDLKENIELSSVIIKARAYSKFDDYNNIYRTDIDCKFKVNEVEFSPLSNEGEDTTYAEFTYACENQPTSFILETINGRLIIEEFVFNYYEV